MAIIGIFFGAVLLTPGIVATDRHVEQEARRLENVIDLVREEALMQSRDYGLRFSDDGYRFYVYDYAQGAWLEPGGDRLLAPHALGEDLELELIVEDRDLLLEPEQDADQEDDGVDTIQPQVLLLSSGEMTPFEAVVSREFDRATYRLVVELNGSTEVFNDATGLD